MLEDMGNAVKIYDTIVPAVNIQVENVPGYIMCSDGVQRWFGVYFEVLFETGTLWEVFQGDDENEPAEWIGVVVSEKWGCCIPPSEKPDDYEIRFDNWASFLEAFEQERTTPPESDY